MRRGPRRLPTDDLNRLTKVVSTAYGNITVNYNPIGNITTNSQVGNYAYGAKSHAVVRAGANGFGYDADGDMDNRARSNICCDCDNHPTEMNGGALSFAYDYTGQRVEKVGPSGTAHYVGKHFENTKGSSPSTSLPGEDGLP